MKLLCINDKRTPASKHFENWVTEGEVYTLRRYTGSLTGKRGVLLNEIKNPSVFIQELAGRTEPSFSEDRFVEVNDSMEIVGKEVNIKEESLILN
jgi:hypothetical protein